LVNFRGVLDCPELPLNVSRSYLQNDAYIRKIAAHISKKVGDKLNALFNTQREELEKNWRDMKTYFQYACLRDEKFGDKVKDVMLFEKVDGGYTTVAEYLGDQGEGEIIYTTDKEAQSYYIDLYREKGKDVVIFDSVIDSSFAQYLESKNDKIKFRRIDSGFDSCDGQNEKLTQLFKSVCNREEFEISFASLGEEGAAALISLPEEGRRFADMMRMYSISAGNNDVKIPTGECLTVNIDNPIIKKLDASEGDDLSDLAKHIYLSAVLLSRTLTADEAKEFVRLNNKLL